MMRDSTHPHPRLRAGLDPLASADTQPGTCHIDRIRFRSQIIRSSMTGNAATSAAARGDAGSTRQVVMTIFIRPRAPMVGLAWPPQWVYTARRTRTNEGVHGKGQSLGGGVREYDAQTGQFKRPVANDNWPTWRRTFEHKIELV